MPRKPVARPIFELFWNILPEYLVLVTLILIFNANLVICDVCNCNCDVVNA